MTCFKAGDRVRCVSNGSENTVEPRYAPGNTGTVLVDPNSDLIRVKWDHPARRPTGKDYVVAYASELELLVVEPAPIPTPEQLLVGHPDEPSDPVNPVHYSRFKIQPIDFILQNDLPFDIGCIVKYALRYDAKDGIQDLEKAKRYLDFRIALLRGATSVAS